MDVHPDVQGRLRMHPGQLGEMSGTIRGGSARPEVPRQLCHKDSDETDWSMSDSTMSGWGIESRARERSQRRSEKKSGLSNRNKKKKAAPKPKPKAKNAQAKAKARPRRSTEAAMERAIERMPCVGACVSPIGSASETEH